MPPPGIVLPPFSASCWSVVVLVSVLVISTLVDTSHAAVCWAGAGKYRREYKEISQFSPLALAHTANRSTWLYATKFNANDFQDPDFGKIRKMRPDGSQATILLCRSGCNRTLSRLRHPDNLYIDPVEQYLYWTDPSSLFTDSTNSAYIGRISLKNPDLGAEIVACENGCQRMFTGRFRPRAIVVDSQVTKRLYFLSAEDDGTGSFIGSVPLPGQSGQSGRILCGERCDHVSPLLGRNFASGSGNNRLQLDLTRTPPRLYFQASSSSLDDLFYSHLDGSNVTKVFTDFISAFTLDLVSSPKRLYYAALDRSAGGFIIGRSSLGGTGRQIVYPAGALQPPSFIHVVGTRAAGRQPLVYFNSQAATITESSLLLRVNGDGTQVRHLLCDNQFPCPNKFPGFGVGGRDLQLGVVSDPGDTAVRVTFRANFADVFYKTDTGYIREAILRAEAPSQLLVRPSGGLLWVAESTIVSEGPDGCNLFPGNRGRAKQLVCATGCEHPYPSLVYQPRALRAVGTTTEQYYWVDSRVGAVITVNSDGSNARQLVCQPRTDCPNDLYPAFSPTDLQVDSRTSSATGAKIYFLTADSALFSANLDGTQPKVVACGRDAASGSAFECPNSTAIDFSSLVPFSELNIDTRAAMPVLYFIDALAPRVWRVNGDGSGLTPLLCRASAGSCVVTYPETPMRQFDLVSQLELSLELNRGFWVYGSDFGTQGTHVASFPLNESNAVPTFVLCVTRNEFMNPSSGCIHTRRDIFEVEEIFLTKIGSDTWLYSSVRFYDPTLPASSNSSANTVPGMIRQRIGASVGAPETLFCGSAVSGCPRVVPKLAVPRSIQRRLNPQNGQSELWWVGGMKLEPTDPASDVAAIWRSTLTGIGAHIEVQTPQIVPSYCGPAGGSGVSQSECDALCPERLNVGNCSKSVCPCTA